MSTEEEKINPDEYTLLELVKHTYRTQKAMSTQLSEYIEKAEQEKQERDEEIKILMDEMNARKVKEQTKEKQIRKFILISGFFGALFGYLIDLLWKIATR